MLCAVRRFWVFIKYWLPLLLWMLLIFIGSADSASVSRSSRIIEPILHWLIPSLPDDAVGTCVLLVRKCAHITEYAFFAILVWRALRKHTSADRRPWTWREPKWTLLIVFAYACLDEIHQVFVPGRGPSVYDVLLDTLGGALGLFLLWRAGKVSRQW